MKFPRLSKLHIVFLSTSAVIFGYANVFPSAAASRHENADQTSQSAITAGLAQDKGTFRIMVNGQQAGKEEFEISAAGGGWTARGTTDISSSQGEGTQVTGTLHLAADGTPLSYEWSMRGEKKASANIQFSGKTATIELRLASSRPFTQQFTFDSSRLAVLDNNMYDQYAILARLYDWQKKGVQTISVLVPQAMTPGTVTAESLGGTTSGDKTLQQLRVKTDDLDLTLFLDGSKLMRIDVPAANAQVIRD